MKRLYVDKNSSWNSIQGINYIENFNPNVEEINNGIILPIRKINGNYCGGVCDSDFNFYAGRSDSWCGVKNSYIAKKINKTINETILFGGVIMLHFGHMLVDSMTRLWWICEHKYTGKIVFCVEWGEIKPWVYEWFELLGLNKDRIIFIFPNDDVYQFKKIIVPGESVINGKFCNKYILPASLMAKNAVKLIDTTKLPKKIYLTRSQFKGGATTYISNENFMEDFFCSKGYSIIAPEQLSVSAQIALLANAQAVATNLGTLSHMILFSSNGIKCDIWLRDDDIIHKQMAIFQLKKADWRLVDAEMSFLPHTHIQGVTLCGPTLSWIDYINNCWGTVTDKLVLPDSIVVDYIKKWAQYLIDFPEVINDMKLNQKSYLKTYYAICKNFLAVDVENKIKLEYDFFAKTEQHTKLLEKKLSAIRRMVSNELTELHGENAVSNWILDDGNVWIIDKLKEKKILTTKDYKKFVRINLPLAFEPLQGDEIEYYITYSLKTATGSVRLMLEDSSKNYINITFLGNSESYRTIQGKFVCNNNGFNSLMLTSTDLIGNDSFIGFEVISLNVINRRYI